MSTGRRKALTTWVAAVLFLGTVGGGLAYTKITVDGADRTAPTKAWKSSDTGLPDARGDGNGEHEGRRDTALSKELLPVPDAYRLGPDIAEFGNDVYLNGAKAEAWLADSMDGLPAEALREHRKFVSELDLQGMAMRSYAHDRDGDLLVEIRLARMRNESAVKQRNAFRAELTEIFSELREGPEIDGHDDASCFLVPEPDLAAEAADGARGIETMYCTAYEDDTLVTFTASGSTPFAEKAVGTLLEQQLDRLTEGGGISV